MRRNFIEMEIKRDQYVNQLFSMRHDGMIKVVTGMRRCGKSYLLFKLFYKRLLQEGVPEDHIISMSFDELDNRQMRDAETFYSWVKGKINDKKMHYLLLDEVQMLENFESVLNSFLHIDNVDVYVTGSNARFLSKDVITEFRGRGFEIRIHPLSFREFMSAFSGDRYVGLQQYMRYGGLPQVALYAEPEQKETYLKSLFRHTYLADIKNRYGIRNDDDLEELINVLASNVGGLTNPKKIENTFLTVKKSAMSHNLIKQYLDYMEDAFLIEKSTRYDIKGKRYISTPYKYYFEDLGLRNARLDFRQYEPTHLLENLIYNELRIRQYNVDVGVVVANSKDENNRSVRSMLEVDFVCNKGSERLYVQSAYALPDAEKLRQESRSLELTKDTFQKIIITNDLVPTYQTDSGIKVMNVFDFLLGR